MAGYEGLISVLNTGTRRASTALQGPGFATDTYVTDSGILIPSPSLRAGSAVVWHIYAGKTAAGVGLPAYSIRIGAAQTTADTARVALSGPAQTAAIDIGVLTVSVVVRTIGASGVLHAEVSWDHAGVTTGFANNGTGGNQAAGAGFDNQALGGLFIGLSINAGASAAWTIEQVHGQGDW